MLDSTIPSPRLRVAASTFEITPDADTLTDARNGVTASRIVSGLKTTVTLLDDGGSRACLVTTHFGTSFHVNVGPLFREAIARDLGIPASNVLLFTSHNHCSVDFASNGVHAYNAYDIPAPEADLLPVGREFLAALREHAARLQENLRPVTAWWTEGKEDRVTYNRKGRLEDGTTCLMREEDRRLLGEDYQGDIDPRAPLVVFKTEDGRAIAGLAQFTGHPVTAFHPEDTIVFGEWPQIACDIVGAHLGDSGHGPVPIGFLQGCAGDINSLGMLSGSVERSTAFGEMLAKSYLDALDNLQPSRRDGFEIAVETASLPLDSLPSRESLEAELSEIDDFIQRAESGDEDTMSCVGQNFGKTLSPKFRAWLARQFRPWTEWALGIHGKGLADRVAKTLDLEIAVLRIGDVGLAGLPCEPFQNIGRQIRARSPLPLAIPCGYMNSSHGYITDADNTGDNEYMSAHHRYTKFRAPLRKPAGDVLADAAIGNLIRFAGENAHEA